MYDREDSLKKKKFNVRFLRESESISDEKYNRTYRLYNNKLEISVEKIIKTKIIDAILRNYLNFIKKLFNALIR